MKKIIQIFVVIMIMGIAVPSLVLAQGQSHRPPFGPVKDKIEKAEEKLEEAEKTSGGMRHDMMSEHMKLMEQALDEMEKMKSAEKMTSKESTDWINGHRELMREMVKQMKRQHKMMKSEHKMMGMHRKMQKSMSKDDN
jgi:acyl-CoA reductase-like NAD-dependent aldehyde dehydrogenase